MAAGKARVKKLREPNPSPAARQRTRRPKYHEDVAGHRRIMEALGSVPEFGSASAESLETYSGEKWSPLKTLFFVITFSATAWAMVSIALLTAFG